MVAARAEEYFQQVQKQVEDIQIETHGNVYGSSPRPVSRDFLKPVEIVDEVQHEKHRSEIREDEVYERRFPPKRIQEGENDEHDERQGQVPLKETELHAGEHSEPSGSDGRRRRTYERLGNRVSLPVLRNHAHQRPQHPADPGRKNDHQQDVHRVIVTESHRREQNRQRYEKARDFTDHDVFVERGNRGGDEKHSPDDGESADEEDVEHVLGAEKIFSKGIRRCTKGKSAFLSSGAD